MLARHAEDLFWTGRYIERAEDTARLLDVTTHGLLEARPARAREAWRELLAVLHLEGAYLGAGRRETTGVSVTEFLVLDPSNPGAIVPAVARARENARTVRERISTELWEAINTFHLELRARDLRDDIARQPYELYRLVKSRCQTVSGVAAETMPRDDGWRFLVLGRMLERAEMTCRLLGVRFGPSRGEPEAGDFQDLTAVLNGVSAFEAYVKKYRAELDPGRVLELLLLSRDFPRSVLFCLRSAERELAKLSNGDGASRPQRLLGRLRADLEFRDVQALLEQGLHGDLDRLQDGIAQAANAVGLQFFRSGVRPEQHAQAAF